MASTSTAHITQDEIMNKPGNAFLGISYYAYGGEDSGSGGY